MPQHGPKGNPHQRRIKIGKFISARAKAGTPLKKKTSRVARLGRRKRL